MASEQVQRRFVPGSSIKLKERSDGAPPTIVGYASVFFNQADPVGTQFRLCGKVYERVLPGAFDNALRTDDVRGLFNHDDNSILGRSKSGTLRLAVDAKGLRYEIDPPDTQAARDLIVSIERGDVSGSSFSFLPRKRNFRESQNPNDPEIVELVDVQLFDVGPVVMPAYSGTEAGLRSLDGDERSQSEVEQLRRPARDRDAIALQLAEWECRDDGDMDDDDDSPILDAPEVLQEYDYDCGAAATAIVCGIEGVGPSLLDGLDAYREAVGSTEAAGTDPKKIVDYLISLGLKVVAKNDLTITDLREQIGQGNPVICCIQDWEDSPFEIPDEEAGHWVVVIGADDETITLQDPWAGRVSMLTYDFLARWEDQDSLGEYVHYGIVVSGQ